MGKPGEENELVERLREFRGIGQYRMREAADEISRLTALANGEKAAFSAGFLAAKLTTAQVDEAWDAYSQALSNTPPQNTGHNHG